jgi:hypothetical protein
VYFGDNQTFRRKISAPSWDRGVRRARIRWRDQHPSTCRLIRLVCFSSDCFMKSVCSTETSGLSELHGITAQEAVFFTLLSVRYADNSFSCACRLTGMWRRLLLTQTTNSLLSSAAESMDNREVLSFFKYSSLHEGPCSYVVLLDGDNPPSGLLSKRLLRVGQGGSRHG